MSFVRDTRSPESALGHTCDPKVRIMERIYWKKKLEISQESNFGDLEKDLTCESMPLGRRRWAALKFQGWLGFKSNGLRASEMSVCRSFLGDYLSVRWMERLLVVVVVSISASNDSR